jgi:uncharacterized protein (TIGR04255 family)
MRVKDKDNGRSLQVQPDKLYFSWSRDSESNPRYKRVKEEFVQAYKRFDEFLATCSLGELKPNLWEVTYVNFVPPGDLWSDPKEWHKVLPAFFPASDPSAGEVVFSSYDGDWHYEISPKLGRLHVHVAKMIMNREPPPALYFRLTARGEIGTEGCPDWLTGLDIGHSSCVKLFNSITSPEAQVAWGVKK